MTAIFLDRNVPDDVVISLLKKQGVQGYMNLLALIGDEHKALVALRSENEFVTTFAGIPFGRDFAAKVRRYIIDNNLEWTCENLARAAGVVGPPGLVLYRKAN